MSYYGSNTSLYGSTLSYGGAFRPIQWTVNQMDEIIKFFKRAGIPVYTAGDTEYEKSVANANLLYRFSRPGCVVQPKQIGHVQTIVTQAKARGITLIIKNGGHSYAGFSTTSDKQISLDLVEMKEVSIDPRSGIVTLQGGAKWAHAYGELVNGHHDGKIINGGRCPNVGVSGFTLGGGLGPFTRSFGMGSDTLTQATIVIADGRIITVSERDNPKTKEGKLFWALCGAGGGNFGVLVEFTMRIQTLHSPDVVGGKYTWLPKEAEMEDFMNTMNRFYTTDWPNDMTIDSSWLCDIKQTKGELAVRFTVYYNGNKEEFDDVIKKNISHPALAKQLKARSVQEKSSRFLHETLVTQWSEEITRANPSTRAYRIYASFVFKHDADRIQKITSIIREEMKAFRRLFADEFAEEKALLQVTWIHAGGKASEKKRSATAFRWRDCVYHTYVMVEWDEKFLRDNMRGFLRTLKGKLIPYSMMGRAAFINFPDDEQAEHEKAYYGNNRQELQKIKKVWDGDHFFRWVQGVQLPPTWSTEAPISPTATDEYASQVPLWNEQLSADRLASQQWDRFTIPPRNDFVGGMYGLNDLGYY